MPAPFYVEVFTVGKLGPNVPVAGCRLGEGGQRVHVADPLGQGRDGTGPLTYLATHLLVGGPLHLRDTLLRIQNQGLVLLELGGDEPLPSNQGLAPDVVTGDLGEVGVADFDVVAEDLVETHFEALDPRALPLLQLQPGDVLPGVPGSVPQLVQLRGEPLSDDVALSRVPGRLGGQRRLDKAGHVVAGTHPLGQPGYGTGVPFLE